MRWLVLCAGLVACTGTYNPPGDDTGDDDPCPTDWHTATSPGMLLSDFRVDGLRLQAFFDDTATYAGRPASCIADDGHAADWLISVVDAPYGRLEAHAATAGSQDLTGGVGTLTIELFGAEPAVTFVNGNWQTGLWSVDDVGSKFTTDLSGLAVQSSRQLQIVVSAEATR